MVNPRRVAWAAILAALLFAAVPASAQGCLPGDPACRPAPPGSVQVNPNASTSEGELASVAAPGELMPIEAVVPMPLNPVAVEPLGGSAAPAFESLSVPVRYQDPSDVSCGVQALGMALDALPGAPPNSDALLGFLQGIGMMYDFGTGVEELALAAQSFGYRGSTSFYGGDLASLASELDAGRPVVVSLGANGTGAPGHFVTVTGVSPDGQWVSYNDPTLGRVTVSAAEFMSLWGLQGYSGVTVAAEPPAAAPDPYPWVALSAMVMALISASPLGRQRLGIGGRITSGGGASPRPAPRPAPAPARPAPRPAPAPARPAPAPAPAPRAVQRAEAAFQASPPPAPRPTPAPIPRAVERAEAAFEASLPPATVPAVTTRGRFDEEAPPTPQPVPTPPLRPTVTPVPQSVSTAAAISSRGGPTSRAGTSRVVVPVYAQPPSPPDGYVQAASPGGFDSLRGVLGWGNRILGISLRANAASNVSVVEVGETLRVYGPRGARSTLGFRTMVNSVRIENEVAILRSTGSQALGALRSPGTPLGLASNIIVDGGKYLTGEYDRTHLAAALTVDTGATVASALVAGAISGAVSGALVGGVLGFGVGAVPAAIVGGIIGAVVALGLSSLFTGTGARDYVVDEVADMYGEWTGQN